MPQSHQHSQPLKENRRTSSRTFQLHNNALLHEGFGNFEDHRQRYSRSFLITSSASWQHHQHRPVDRFPPGVVQTVSLPPYEDSPWPISTVGAQVNSLPYFSFSPEDSMNTFLFKCSITFLLTGQIPLKWETQTK